LNEDLFKKIIEISGRNPNLCYQCGMCTVVCPINQYMDLKPHVIIRYVQLKSIDFKKLSSVWKCVSCMACVDRCPRDVGPGVIFEAIRSLVLRKGIDAVDYNKLVDFEKTPSMALIALSRKMTG